MLLGFAGVEARNVLAQGAAQGAGATHTFTDEVGRRVQIPREVDRVVSLAPNLTEIVFALGEGNRLAGDTDFCDYPAEATQKPHVGGPVNPNMEEIVALKPGTLPAATTRKCEDLLIDVVGLCVTARHEDYVRSALGAYDDAGPCTAIGHQRRLTASGAAFVNGTAAHGEDFDDTFEGGPVHAGAVIVPAVLAACERRLAEAGVAAGDPSTAVVLAAAARPTVQPLPVPVRRETAGQERSDFFFARPSRPRRGHRRHSPLPRSYFRDNHSSAHEPTRTVRRPRC
jgi:hypothetical protein